MKKWEYKSERFMSEQSIDWLNEQGQQGWELVKQEWQGDWIVYMFKKELLKRNND